MGTGIMAAIPINIKIERREYFSDNFFKNYNGDEAKRIFTINRELLIDNYYSFLDEFYACINEDYDVGEIPIVKTYEEFVAAFESDKRNMSVPFLYNDIYTFSYLGGYSNAYWLFYSGSYKAYLEGYSTLMHFERVLVKAMKNPLVNAVKFGIFG